MLKFLFIILLIYHLPSLIDILLYSRGTKNRVAGLYLSYTMFTELSMNNIWTDGTKGPNFTDKLKRVGRFYLFIFIREN